MVFSSPLFLFGFLPALFAVYFAVPARYRSVRNFVLLAFSLGFYACGEPKFVFVMLASIALNYGCGLLTARENTRRLGVWLAAVCGIGLLVWFKYTGFLLTSANSFLGLSLPVPEITLPIGISFFTFQGLSYVLDVARGTVAAQKNPLHVALYVSLFPQLIAGPIVRYETIAEEIMVRRETIDEMAAGIRRFCIGLAKKMILANAMAAAADEVFAVSAEYLTWDLAWVGAIAYTFQIYFDFSAYSDMAIGLGRMLGFHFLENFNYPYISRSVTEFWRRWHISLSTWFRDYVYIPLGGNRVGAKRHLVNIMAVWLLTGIWHGANWTFLCWGLYFGVLLLVEKFFLGKYLKRLPAALSMLYAFALAVIGWVIFRADTLAMAGEFIAAMFTPSADVQRHTIYLLVEYRWEFLACIIGSFPIAKLLAGLRDRKSGLLALENVWASVCFAASVVWMISSTFNPFIYFRF